MTVYLHNFIRSYTLYAWSYKELLAVNKHVKPLILYVISPLLLVVLLILFSLLLLQLQEFWNTHRKREQNWTVYHPRNIVGVITQRRLINHAQDMASLWNITEQKNGSLYVCLSINILFSSFCLSAKHFFFSSIHIVPWYCAYNSRTVLKFGRFPAALVSSLWNLKALGLYILSLEVMIWFIIL